MNYIERSICVKYISTEKFWTYELGVKNEVIVPKEDKMVSKTEIAQLVQQRLVLFSNDFEFQILEIKLVQKKVDACTKSLFGKIHFYKLMEKLFHLLDI